MLCIHHHQIRLNLCQEIQLRRPKNDGKTLGRQLFQHQIQEMDQEPSG